MGAETKDSERAFRDHVGVYTDIPEKIDFEEHKDEIISFYSKWQFNKKSNKAPLEEFIEVIKATFDDTFYYYHNKDYYKLHLLIPYMPLKSLEKNCSFFYEHSASFKHNSNNERNISVVLNCESPKLTISISTIM